MPYNSAPFSPGYNRGVIVSPGAASATATVTGATQTVCLTNLGANVCYIRFGETAPVVATTADYPVPGGAQVTITKPGEYSLMAYISAGGTSLHVMPGEGF